MPKMTPIKNYDNTSVDVLVLRGFRGVDYTSAPSSVDKDRSCYAVNMIRDTPGVVVKRTGYHLLSTYAGKINGIFHLRDREIVHAGTNYYYNGASICSGVADVKSSGIQMNGKLMLFDGTTYRIYGEFDGTYQVKTASDIATVPKITIGRAPNGGGQSYNPVNMLQPKRTEGFLGTAGATVYQLSFSGLSSAAVTAQVMSASGTWVDKTEGTDFSVDRATGEVTFTAAPGATPVTGEDNVLITYAKDNASYLSRVNKCLFAICYGVGGASDRLFISGCSDYPNYSFFSQLDDPAYFGDIWYILSGQAHSPITGYSIVNNKLSVHKKNDDEERNAYLYYGALNDAGDPKFTQTDIIQGTGAIAPHSFAYAKEPLFLTAQGICATTPMEYNSERYIQNRSFFVNSKLTKEANLSEAYACVYKEFYIIAVGTNIYILDTLVRTAENTIRSNYQYESYVWEGISARVIYADDDGIRFGDANGNVYAFYSDYSDAISYNDNGAAISARWDFDVSGEFFYQNKKFKTIGIKLAAAPATSAKIYARVKGLWNLIMDTQAKARYFMFSNLTFSKLCFKSDQNPRTITKKIKIKKVDTVRFSIRNEELNEPFGLYEVALEYIEAGRYKG